MHFLGEMMPNYELENLRIALVIAGARESDRAADRGSATDVAEDYVTGRPTQQMTATWGS